MALCYSSSNCWTQRFCLAPASRVCTCSFLDTPWFPSLSREVCTQVKGYVHLQTTPSPDGNRRLKKRPRKCLNIPRTRQDGSLVTVPPCAAQWMRLRASHTLTPLAVVSLSEFCQCSRYVVEAPGHHMDLFSVTWQFHSYLFIPKKNTISSALFPAI